MHTYHVIIPAAGNGSRMQSQLPKQYLHLNGHPVLEHTIRVFDSFSAIQSIHVMLSPDDGHWAELEFDFSEKVHVHFAGGATRAQTVAQGLLKLQAHAHEDDWVLVHDAARPGLSHAALQRLLDEAGQHAVGGLLALPVADTLKMADARHEIINTPPREGIWRAQTPQMFRYHVLSRALADNAGQFTDESQAVEALGFRPKLVRGETRNLKITYPEDLHMLEILLQAADKT